MQTIVVGTNNYGGQNYYSNTQKSTKTAISMPSVHGTCYIQSVTFIRNIATVDTIHIHENFHGRKLTAIVLT